MGGLLYNLLLLKTLLSHFGRISLSFSSIVPNCTWQWNSRVVDLIVSNFTKCWLLTTAFAGKVMLSVASVRLPVYVLFFEPTDFTIWCFACVRVMTIAHRDVTVKVISHVRRSMQIVRAASYEYWLVATEVGFHCDVAISCKLATGAAWRGRVGVVTRPVWPQSSTEKSFFSNQNSWTSHSLVDLKQACWWQSANVRQIATLRRYFSQSPF